MSYGLGKTGIFLKDLFLIVEIPVLLEWYMKGSKAVVEYSDDGLISACHVRLPAFAQNFG